MRLCKSVPEQAAPVGKVNGIVQNLKWILQNRLKPTNVGRLRAFMFPDFGAKVYEIVQKIDGFAQIMSK